ncbi:MAG: hypothetical protein EP307_12240 [Rhodobacteraceae bacterium]|nr:MAG: hypothetical protein EP307_12240 [Paracoccaceae bacterium]
MRNLFCILAVIAVLAGCTNSPQSPNADDATIAAVSYKNQGPTTLTLYTVLNNRTNAGAHTSLLIGASERVLFDPAGSFKAKGIPERNDVLFGFSPEVERIYAGAHARETYRVVIQTLEVSPQQAEQAYRLALQAGPVAGGFCASATAGILRQIPGFETIRGTFYPDRLMTDFGKIPGVQTRIYREYDDPSLEKALAALN